MLLDDPYVFRAVVDGMHLGFCLADCDHRIVYWNRGAEQVTGFMRHEVLGRPWRDSGVLHYNTSGAELCDDDCPLAQSMRDGKRTEAQIFLRHKAGHQVPVRVWTMPIRNDNNLIIGAAESFEIHDNIAAQFRHQAALAAHGCLDFITGLPNHGLTQSHLRESLALFREHHLPFGLLCIEVEDMPQFAEAHSSEAMHAVLHVSAQTIAHVLDAAAFLGRWSENQFVAIVSECDRVELEKLRKEVYRAVNCTGIQWWGDPLSIRASVGGTMAEPNDTLETITERARQTLHQNPAPFHSVFPRIAGQGGPES